MEDNQFPLCPPPPLSMSSTSEMLFFSGEPVDPRSPLPGSYIKIFSNRPFCVFDMRKVCVSSLLGDCGSDSIARASLDKRNICDVTGMALLQV